MIALLISSYKNFEQPYEMCISISVYEFENASVKVFFNLPKVYRR